MRTLIPGIVLVLVASGVQASSGLDIFGVVDAPIQVAAVWGGGRHSYSAPNLEPRFPGPGADAMRI